MSVKSTVARMRSASTGGRGLRVANYCRLVDRPDGDAAGRLCALGNEDRLGNDRAHASWPNEAAKGRDEMHKKDE